jgi:DNA-binding transcriptional LysR family regulator
MSKPKPSLDDLRIFVFVAQLGNFSRVAEHLKAVPSSISMSISRLETQLGARLFQRTTRRVVLTDEGMALLARTERLLEDFEEISGLFRQTDSRLSGRLRVDVPLGMASGVVMHMLPEFLARHPDLKLEVFSTDRRVDVIADGFDCVVRVGAVVDDTLVCRPLGWLPLVNVASQGYIDTYGTPCDLVDLETHYLVNYVPNSSYQSAGFEYLDAKVTRAMAMPHRITVNNSAAYGAACRAGFGIAQLPLFSVEAYLESGALVQLMPQHTPAPMPINQLYPHRRNVPRRVRVFGDWLANVVETSLCARHVEM